MDPAQERSQDALDSIRRLRAEAKARVDESDRRLRESAALLARAGQLLRESVEGKA